MSLKIVLLFVSIATAAGLVLGYYLRLIISLGRKGSMELRLRQIELLAKDKEKEIIRGNSAVAEYFGRIVSAGIVGISIIIAAAVLGGLLAGLR